MKKGVSFRGLVEQSFRPGEGFHRPADRTDARVLELEVKAREMAAALKKMLPDGVGFTLFLHGYGADDRLSYLSTAHREDMIRTIGAWVVAQLDEEENRS